MVLCLFIGGAIIFLFSLFSFFLGHFWGLFGIDLEISAFFSLDFGD